MYPKSFFAKNQIQLESGYCFVLMPFAQRFKAVYDAIAEALEGPDANLSCERADELFGGGHIIEDILRGIAKAEVVIADVTTRNPNVFYELGIAHTVKDIDKVLILTQSMKDVPFDLRQFRVIKYEQSPGGFQKLKRNLLQHVQKIITLPSPFSLSAGQGFKYPDKLAGSDKCLYDFELSNLIAGHDFVKFRLDIFRHTVNYPIRKVHSHPCSLAAGEFLERKSISDMPWRLKLVKVEKDAAYFLVFVKVTKHKTKEPKRPAK